MKKWMQQIPRFLENLCVSFTLAVLLYSLWGAQKETMRRGWLYEIFFICVLATLLQGVFFYENRWTKRVSYLWRMVFYGVAMLVVVSLCAIGFQWEKDTMPSARGRWLERARSVPPSVWSPAAKSSVAAKREAIRRSPIGKHWPLTRGTRCWSCPWRRGAPTKFGCILPVWGTRWPGTTYMGEAGRCFPPKRCTADGCSLPVRRWEPLSIGKAPSPKSGERRFPGCRPGPPPKRYHGKENVLCLPV